MPVVLAPHTKTSPREGRSTPASALSRVDFPAPFGPTTAAIFPGYTLIETSSMIGGPPHPADPASARSTGTGAGSAGASAGSAMAEVHPEVGIDHLRVAAQPGERSL